MRTIAFLKLTGLFVTAARSLRPELVNSPIVVVQGSAVYAACDKAMALGIQPGMTLRAARLACPAGLETVSLKDINPSPLSCMAFDICAEHSPIVEPIHFDECFIELTGSCITPQNIGKQVLHSLHSKLALSGSMGVASSRLIARLSCPSSPNTLTILKPDQEVTFLSDTLVDKLWLLPREAINKLQQLGVLNVKDLKAIPVSELTLQFRDLAKTMETICTGIDNSKVNPLYPPPSILCKSHFCEPIHNLSQLQVALYSLVDEGAEQLERAENVCKTAILQVTFDSSSFAPSSLQSHLLAHEFKFNSYTRSAYRLKTILSAWLSAKAVTPISELKLRLSDLRPETDTQLSLYTTGVLGSSQQSKSSSIDETLNSLNSRYGLRAISLGLKEEPDRREVLLRHFIPRPYNYTRRQSLGTGS